MALKKSLLLPSGVTVDYWRVVSVTPYLLENACEIVVGAYLDQEAREAGAVPVFCEPIRLVGDDVALFLTALIDAAGPLVYGALKDTDKFNDAESV
jgi:hypothetical protein